MKILVLGANGYVGRLTAAAALGLPDSEVVVAIRHMDEAKALTADIEQTATELVNVGLPLSCCAPTSLQYRIKVVEFNSGLFDNPLVLGADLCANCVGAVDYFNEKNLVAVNIDLTQWIVNGCRKIGIQRHIYVSTAFAPAVNDRVIEERIYDQDDGDDPTIYTRTKRQAEHIVSQSCLEYTILRPSVIIGDSRTGVYFGKRYGLYQLWEGAKRLLPEKIELMRLASPHALMNFLHQDAYVNVALKVIAHSPDNPIVNIVSAKETSPTLEELWSMLFDAIGWPDRLEWAPDNDSLDYNGLSNRIKAFNAFCRTNIDIASRDWTFERGTVDRMIAASMTFPEATLSTIHICQTHFLDGYDRTNGRFFSAR